MKTRKSRGLLASYSRRRRTGLGRMPDTGTSTGGNLPSSGSGEGRITLSRRQKLLRSVLSRFGRLKYSMAWRSRLGMQISGGESHVSARGLILYPETGVSYSPSTSPSLFSLSPFYSHPSYRARFLSTSRLVSLDGFSFHLNVHQCFQRNFLISSATSCGKNSLLQNSTKLLPWLRHSFVRIQWRGIMRLKLFYDN